MLLRTHLAFAFLIGMMFFKYVSSPVVFMVVLIIATYLPDVDTAFSSIGAHWPFRFLQWFVKHRGIFHSLTLTLVFSIILSFVYPLFALPFFLGYSLHIYLDSFTVNGITPFWPLKAQTSWKITTGSKSESSFLVFLLIADLLVFVLVVI